MNVVTITTEPIARRTTKKADDSADGARTSSPTDESSAYVPLRQQLNHEEIDGVCELTTAERFELIAVTAYYLAESRDFMPGMELDDWLAAENQVDGSSTLAADA
jgi:hypothetical protein